MERTQVTPKELFKYLYDAYKDNMKLYSKPILSYEEWLVKVLVKCINEI